MESSEKISGEEEPTNVSGLYLYQSYNAQHVTLQGMSQTLLLYLTTEQLNTLSMSIGSKLVENILNVSMWMPTFQKRSVEKSLPA